MLYTKKKRKRFGIDRRIILSLLLMMIGLNLGLSESLAQEPGAESETGWLVIHSIGTNARDFPRLQDWEDARSGDLIHRHFFATSNQNAAFLEGETVIGLSSGAEGLYLKERAVPSAAETQMSLDNVFGVFQVGETLLGTTSGASATLDLVHSTTGTIEKGEAYADAIFDQGIVIKGSLTDAQHYLWLSAAPTQEHAGLAGGGVVIDPTASGHVIDLGDAYSRIEGLEITGWPNQKGSNSWEGVHVAADNVLLERLLIHDDDYAGFVNPNSDAIYINGLTSGQRVTVRNSLIYNIGRGAINYQGAEAIDITLQNVTIFNTGLSGSKADGEGGINNLSGTATLNVVNTISMGSSSGEDFKNNGFYGNASNNLSSDQSAPGNNSLWGKLVGDQFLSIVTGSEDLRLKPTADAVDSGIDLTSEFGVEIDGGTRVAPWDMGADEYREETLTITTESLPAGTAGNTYLETLSLSGGIGPYNWTRLSGTLPEGLSLSGEGVISGTPFLEGSFAFNLQVVDSTGLSATKDFTMEIGSGADTQAPAIFNIQVTALQANAASIAWTTDEAADGLLNYGESTAYGLSVSQSTFSTSHSLQLTNLSANTLYHFIILSKDAAGNVGSSSDLTFTTLSPPDLSPPTTPANLVAESIGTTQITFRWDPATDNVGVSGYRVYRNGVMIATTSTTRYSDSGLSPTTNYGYQVQAFDALGNESPMSATLALTTSALPDLEPPSIPTNLSATAAASSQIDLNWSPATDNVGVSGYRIFRNGLQIGTTPNTQYSDNGLTANTAYTYSLVAYDAAGNESGQSPALTESTFPSGTLNQVDLSWNPSSDNVGVAGYRVYRNGIAIAITATNRYLDTGLIAGASYVYTVVAFDMAGNESEHSTPLSVTVGVGGDTLPPSTPSNLAATATSSSQINLNWTVSSDNVGVSGYRVFRDGVEIGTSTTSSYSDTGLQANTAYSYRIAALDAAGNASALSSAASALTDSPEAPSDPLALTNLNVASGRNYEIIHNGLADEALIYIDRTYVYAGLPAAFSGATYIKTANSDKKSTGSSFLSFNVNQAVSVYIAHDDRITSKPAWMNAFSDTGQNVTVDGKLHSLWTQNFPSGKVNLGGNEGGSNSSMYTVFVLKE